MLEYVKFNPELSDEDMRHIEAEIKYEGYLRKQEVEIRRLLKSEKQRIPGDIRFEQVPGLTAELVEALNRQRPKTLGEAKSLPGMTPAALINIQTYLAVSARKLRNKGKKAQERSTWNNN